MDADVAAEFASLRRMIGGLTTVVGELIVSTGDAASQEAQLGQDVTQAVADESSLKSTVTTALADIKQEIDNLKGQVPDPAVLANLDQQVQALHSSLNADTSQVAAADPGAAPAPALTPTPPAPTP